MPINIQLPESFGNGTTQAFLDPEGVDTVGFGFSIIFNCNFSKSFGENLVQAPIFGISLAWIQPAYSPVTGHDHSNQFEMPGNLFFSLLNSIKKRWFEIANNNGYIF